MPDFGGSSRDVTVRLRAEVASYIAQMRAAGAATSGAARDAERMNVSTGRMGSQIDTLSGRLGLVVRGLGAVGPAAIPITGLAIPALSGLAAQAGFATLAAGTMVGAFQGVGDALKAVNKAAIEPTATNIEAANRAMAQISPEAQAFVQRLREFGPELKQLRDLGAANMFPGFTEGLDALDTAAPRVERIVGAVSSALGDIGADTGKSLASERWAPFLTFLADEAPAALQDMAKIAGNTGHAMAELWMAFDPANDDFSHWLVDATHDLDKWAAGLSKTQGFAEFLNYLETEGPQVGATLGAIANALLQIVQAAAPIAGPVLHTLEALADVVGSIADSDLGTPIFGTIAAVSALSLATRTWGSVSRGITGTQTTMLGNYRKLSTGVRTFGSDLKAVSVSGAMTTAQLQRSAVATGRLGGQLKTAGKGAAVLGGLAIASTGVADKVGLANTASLALMGTIAGPWGVAIGAGAGALLDLSHSTDQAEASLTRLRNATRTDNFGELSSSIRDAKKELDDFEHHTGIQDWFSDTAKSFQNDFLGAFTGNQPLNDIKNMLPTAEIQKDAARSAVALGLLRDGFVMTAAGARTAAMGADEFSKSIESMYARLAARASVVDLEASIDAFRTTLKQAKHDAADAGEALIVDGKINIKGDSGAGRAVRTALDAIANSGLKAAEAVQDVGQRSKILDRTRNAFIRAAVAAGIARGDARRLANTLINLGQLKPVITPKVNTGPAHSAVNQLINDITSRHPTIGVTVKPANSLAGLLAPGGADGMTVPGARHPYGDKVLIAAAPGEEVITNRNGEADQFRADRAAGRIPAYANGGKVGRYADGGSVTYQAGAGVTVIFPAPATLSASVKAANQVAAAAANTARSAADTRGAHLDDLHLQQQIRDTQRSLLEHEDKVIKVRNKHGKGTHNKTLKGKGGLSLVGLDRTTALAELADYKAQLTGLRLQSTAAAEALANLQQARTDTAASLTGATDPFARGASATSVTAVVNRDIRDITQYGQNISALRNKGASAALLKLVDAKAQSGDFNSANRLARSLLDSPAAFGNLTAALGARESAAASVASITTDPQFLSSGAWNPTSLAPQVTTQVLLGADPSSWLSEVKRVVSYEVGVQLAQAVS